MSKRFPTACLDTQAKHTYKGHAWWPASRIKTLPAIHYSYTTSLP